MSKTLMPYPRLSYGFSLILQLNAHFYSPISDSCILCEQHVERAVFEIILDLIAEVQEVGKNVATSQRRDVGSTRMEVNKARSLNVATFQRHDVSAISPSQSLKAKGTRIRGHRKTYRLGHGKQSSSDEISGEDSCFCIFFFPKRLLMFYILILCIPKFSIF